MSPITQVFCQCPSDIRWMGNNYCLMAVVLFSCSLYCHDAMITLPRS